MADKKNGVPLTRAAVGKRAAAKRKLMSLAELGHSKAPPDDGALRRISSKQRSRKRKKGAAGSTLAGKVLPDAEDLHMCHAYAPNLHPMEVDEKRRPLDNFTRRSTRVSRDDVSEDNESSGSCDEPNDIRELQTEGMRNLELNISQKPLRDGDSPIPLHSKAALNTSVMKEINTALILESMELSDDEDIAMLALFCMLL